MRLVYISLKKQSTLCFVTLLFLFGLYACVTRKSTATQTPIPSAEQAAQASTTATPQEDYYSTNDQIIAKGQQLFEANCTACHSFRQKGIGPNLATVTSEVSADWLTKFIKNAPQVIASGDSRAVKLLEEYKQYMPPFPTLSDTDLQAIASYIHKNQYQANEGAENEVAGLADPIPAKIAKSGLQLMLEEVTTAPATADKVPLARINKMLVLPGKTNRLFIQDLRGILYEMKSKSLQACMDLNKDVPGFIHTPGLATGFGSYAFHPEFYKNGLLYTTHSEKAHAAPADFAYADSIRVFLQWVVMEWKITDPMAATFSGKSRELFRVNMESNIHGMQDITFNPQAKPGSPDYGMLYIGIGDGGSSEHGFPFICNSNKTIWSSVLRIDPQGKNSNNGRYGIPAYNPYANDNDPETLGEVFCRGFRNPNRIIWTPDGKMLITDIGHANAEEINIGKPGADYGWPEREGTFVINPRAKMDRVFAIPVNNEAIEYTYPVAQYDHDEGKAISAGYVYPGQAIPQLNGKYIFGDIVNGRVFYVNNKDLTLGKQALVQEMDIVVDGKTTTFQDLSGSKKTDLRFGLGLNNDMYMFTKADGKIYKVTGCTAN